MKRYTTKCEVCGKDVTNYPSRKRRFCCHTCCSKKRVELKIINCCGCGNLVKKTSPNQDRCLDCSQKNRKNLNRRLDLLRRYNLSELEHKRLFDKQHGCCALCGQAKKLVVDHCHNTGAVRGLLCFSCNVGLGGFKDDLATLKNAVLYLSDFCL